MALGIQDPSYWGPKEQFHREVERKTLTPLRTWKLKSDLTARTLRIEQDGEALYTTTPHYAVTKPPHVTLHHKDDEKTVIAGVKLVGPGTYQIYLGDSPSTDSNCSGAQQECTVTLASNTRALEHRFSPTAEQKNYSWRDAAQHEITIGSDTASSIETSGRDWKFISLTPDGEENELLAVYIHSPKASLRHKSQIFWFNSVSTDLELWALAAVVGLVERRRKSKDKWNFTTVVGAGAVM